MGHLVLFVKSVIRSVLIDDLLEVQCERVGFVGTGASTFTIETDFELGLTSAIGRMDNPSATIFILSVQSLAHAGHRDTFTSSHHCFLTDTFYVYDFFSFFILILFCHWTIATRAILLQLLDLDLKRVHNLPMILDLFEQPLELCQLVAH